LTQTESIPGIRDSSYGRRSKIATEFTVTLEHRPGQLASLSKSLGEADVNIRALSGMVCEGKGILKLLTSDETATQAKLEELGLPYEEQEILTVTVPDRPGQLGDFAEMLGEADINIETIFVIDTASGFTELAIAVDNIEKAKTLPLGQF
jgi:hypothetical protein